MGYINANNLIVFPCSNRTNAAHEGNNYLTEYNIARTLRRIAGNDGTFVITENTPSTGVIDTEEAFEFCIDGYYFRVDTAAEVIDAVDPNVIQTTTPATYLTITKNGNNIEASISIINSSTATGTDDSFLTLQGADPGDVQVLSITSDKQKKARVTSGGNAGVIKSLVLLESVDSTNNTWRVPLGSKLSFRNLIIDDGEL